MSNERKVEAFLRKFDLRGYLERNGVEKLVLSGENLMGCCPFHDDDNPSWGINIKNGLYQCFSCGETGNIFTLMKHFGDDVGGEFEGIEIEPPDDNELKKLQKELLELIADDRKKRALFPMPKAIGVNDLRDDSPLQKAFLRQVCFKRKMRIKTCLSFGLKVCVKEGKWKNRVLVPIHDVDGNYVFFAGRKLEDNSSRRKWLYPEGCDRSKHVYNLYRLFPMGMAVVVEGQFDVMKFYQEGIPAVSIMSAFISDAQIALLAKVDRVVLLFDGDFAGRTATRKVASVLYKKGIEVSANFLPAGVDPDQLNVKSAFGFIENARPVLGVKGKLGKTVIFG